MAEREPVALNIRVRSPVFTPTFEFRLVVGRHALALKTLVRIQELDPCALSSMVEPLAHNKVVARSIRAGHTI